MWTKLMVSLAAVVGSATVATGQDELDITLRADHIIDGRGNVLEERDILDNVLGVMLSPNVDGVQVMIAGEGRWEELSHCSMILSRYGEVGRFSGALGVVGPTRMHYDRAISVVRYVSEVMSGMLLDIHGTPGH